MSTYICRKCKLPEDASIVESQMVSSSSSNASSNPSSNSRTSTPILTGQKTPSLSSSPVEQFFDPEQRASSDDATACFMTPISIPMSATSTTMATFSQSLQVNNSSRHGVSSTLIENVMRHLRVLSERRSELTELDLLRELTMLLTGHRYSSPAGRLTDDATIQHTMDDSCFPLDQDVRNWLETEMNPLQLSTRSADNSECHTDNERDEHPSLETGRNRSLSQTGRSISASTPRSASRTVSQSRLLSGRRLSSRRSIVPIITAPSVLSSGVSSGLSLSQTAPIIPHYNLTRSGSASYCDNYEQTVSYTNTQASTPTAQHTVNNLAFQYNRSPSNEANSISTSAVTSPLLPSIMSEPNISVFDLSTSFSNCNDSVSSPVLKSVEFESFQSSHSPSTSPRSPVFVMRVTSHEGVEAETAIRLPSNASTTESNATASSSLHANSNVSSTPSSVSPNLSISVSCDASVFVLPDMSTANVSVGDTLALRRPYYRETLNKLDYWFELLNEDRSPKSAPCLYEEDGGDSDAENENLLIPVGTTIVTDISDDQKEDCLLNNAQYTVTFNIPAPIADALDATLHIAWNSLNDWLHFDIFQLTEATNRWPLSFMFLMVCQKHGLFASLHINPAIAFRFIQEVEAGYLNNPYHTSAHAADVLHALYIQITETFLFTKLTDIEKLALFIAAAIHDYAHPGVNNAFLINQSHPLALTYNDRSVLESYHIAQVFHMMDRIPCANILCEFSRTDQKKIRKIIIDCVMATDLAYHFDLLSQMKSKIQLSLDYDFEGDRSLLMQMCLKCADISHPSRSRHLHLQWAELLTEEFFLQGDREKRAGMPPSMFMDRSNAALGRSQIGFISVFVLPLYREMGTFLQRDMWTKQVEDNLLVWQEVHKEEEREKENPTPPDPSSTTPSLNTYQDSSQKIRINSPSADISPNIVSPANKYEVNSAPSSHRNSVHRRTSIASPKTLQAFTFPYTSSVSGSQSSSKTVSSPPSRMSLPSIGNYVYTHRSSVSSSPGRSARSSRRNRASKHRRSLSADGRRRAHSLWASFTTLQNTTTTQIPISSEETLSPAPHNALSPHTLSVPTPSRYLSLRTRDMFHRVRQISESTCSSYTSSPAVSPLSTSPLPSPIGYSPYKHSLRVISWR
jgi:hypothetical protein